MYNLPPQQPPPPMFPPCPECHGRRVRALLTSEGWMGDVRNVSMTALRLLICPHCGYSALYVADLPAFREFIQKHPESFPS